MRTFWMAVFIVVAGTAWGQLKPSPTPTKVLSEDAVKVRDRVSSAQSEWVKKKVLAQDAEARMAQDKELLTSLTLELRALETIIAGGQDSLEAIEGTAVDISKPIRTPTPTRTGDMSNGTADE